MSSTSYSINSLMKSSISKNSITSSGLNESSNISFGNNVVLNKESVFNFTPFVSGVVNSTQSITNLNGSLNVSTKSWKDLTKPEFSNEDLLAVLNDIAQLSKIMFQNHFVENSIEKINLKNTKIRIKSLRDYLFKIYLAKNNYKQDNIFPKERTSVDMIGDIYTLAHCFVDETINFNILDLFNSSVKDDSQITADIKKIIKEQNELLLNRIKIENSSILTKIQFIECNLKDVRKNVENVDDSQRAFSGNLTNLFNNEITLIKNAINNNILTFENPSKRKKMNGTNYQIVLDDFEMGTDQPETSKSNQSETINPKISDVIKTNQSESNKVGTIQLNGDESNSKSIVEAKSPQQSRPVEVFSLLRQGSLKDKVILTKSNLSLKVQKSNQQQKQAKQLECQETMIQKEHQVADMNKLVQNVENQEQRPKPLKKIQSLSYARAVIIKPPTKTNVNICKTTNQNGNAKLTCEISKKTGQSNDGYILSNGKKRYNKKTSSIVGSAISDIKTLSARSQPYSYYIGQWSPRVDPKKIYNLISAFAKIIKLEELSPNIPNRYYRSFKVTVESHYAKEMLNCMNWPSGIVVSIWRDRNRNRDMRTMANLPVNCSKILEKTYSNDVAERVNQVSMSANQIAGESMNRVEAERTYIEENNEIVVTEDQNEEEENDQDMSDEVILDVNNENLRLNEEVENNSTSLI